MLTRKVELRESVEPKKIFLYTLIMARCLSLFASFEFIVKFITISF